MHNCAYNICTVLFCFVLLWLYHELLITSHDFISPFFRLAVRQSHHNDNLCVTLLIWVLIPARDLFVNMPSQWEMTLHWLGSYTKWSLTGPLFSPLWSMGTPLNKQKLSEKLTPSQHECKLLYCCNLLLFFNKCFWRCYKTLISVHRGANNLTHWSLVTHIFINELCHCSR